jgi:2-phospho-L-lactate transferase/gluconeogenesis factor (CofD/UPF0052 family)
MLLIFYSGIRTSNILHSLITYLPQNKLGVVIDTSNILNLSNMKIYLCLRALVHSLMRVEYDNSYRVFNYLRKFDYTKQIQFTDFDVAMSIFLNELLSKGEKLSEIIEKIRKNFLIEAKILPVNEEFSPIYVKTGQKTLPYIEYLQTNDIELKIQELSLEEVENKKTCEDIKEIANSTEYILLLPDDLVSFYAMLHIPGLKKILEDVPCPSFAICPITAASKFKPNYIDILHKIGYTNINALEFSKLLENLVDTIIIDESQKEYREQIQNLGFQVIVGNLAIQNKAQSFELSSFLFNIFPLKETVKPSKTNVVTRFFSRLMKRKPETT